MTVVVGYTRSHCHKTPSPNPLKVAVTEEKICCMQVAIRYAHQVDISLTHTSERERE